MTRIAYWDFDEFAEAINGVSGRFVPTARAETEWWVRNAPVAGVSVQQLQIGAAATFVGDGKENSITLGLPATAQQHIRIDGELIEDNSFVLCRAGQLFTAATAHATQWTGIHVPLDHASLAPEFHDSLQAAALHGTHSKSDLTQVASARQLTSRLFADDGTVDFSEPTAVHAMEQEITATVSHLLEASSETEPVRGGRPRFSRDSIVARALELIEESDDQPVLLRDLCLATQVSERTLRNIFQEYFGVGPMRMLKVTQLSEIRSALVAADAGETTIAGIVTSRPRVATPIGVSYKRSTK